jgi:SAM-dependent methyltransferase
MYIADQSIQIGKDLLIRLPKRLVGLLPFLRDFTRFRRGGDGRFAVPLKEVYPCLNDKVYTTPFDQHYIYHPAWAARILAETKPEYHVDISSILSFSTLVSAFLPVRFYDYRPAELELEGLTSERADLMNLAFGDDSIASLSCMHTIEHVGLGRYGDKLDPQADLRAISELKRVLKPGGDLLFVTPVGRPMVAFNAHRIYSYEQIVEAFHPLVPMEFSLVPDAGGLIRNADPAMVADQRYGCGCFWFRKPANEGRKPATNH